MINVLIQISETWKNLKKCLTNIVNVYVSASVCFYRLRNKFERKIRKINFWHQNVIQKSRRYSTRIGGFSEKKNRDLGNILIPYLHTIRKVKFLPRNSILTKPQHFHEFFTQIFFWQFFSWNQSCQLLKSPKPQHFHEFFTQKIDNFLGKSKLNFWTKNEDFEQCGHHDL